MNQNYFKLDELITPEIQIEYGINLIPRPHPLLQSPALQYFIYPVQDNDQNKYVCEVLNALPEDSFSYALDSYHQQNNFGYNDIWVGIKNGSIHFGVIDEGAELDKVTSDILFNKYFTNYYWYMESLPKSEHPKWYEEYVVAMKKYYSKQVQEIGARIADGNVVKIH